MVVDESGPAQSSLVEDCAGVNEQARGQWRDPPPCEVPARDDPETPALVALEQGRCPVDGMPITWGGVVQVQLPAAP